MVATVHVIFDFAGTDNSPGTMQDTNGLGPPNRRFKTADDATIDAINPIPIPTAGNNFSFWKQIYLEVTTAGGFTQIDNVQYYTDGSNFGTGIATWVGDENPLHSLAATTGYDLATGTVGTTGDRMDSGTMKHTDITARTDAFSFTSGCTRAITISEAGAIINVVNESTNYIVIQMDVTTTASPGDLTDETWTYQYDEI